MSNFSDLYPSGGGEGGEVVAQKLLDHFVLLNGDAEALEVLLATDVTPSSFATWISGSGKVVKFKQLISSPNGALAIVFSRTAMDAVVDSSVAMEEFSLSSVAMNAVAASSTAMNIVAASSTARTIIGSSGLAFDTISASNMAIGKYVAGNAQLDPTLFADMNAVAASSTAMNAVAASDVASDAVFTSSTAKLAVWNSDTALSAYQANPTQVQRQITERGVQVSHNGTSGDRSFTYVPLNTKVILLRAFHNTNNDFELAWRTTSTTVSPTPNSTDGVLLPNGDSLGTTELAIGRTTNYSNSGTAPTANNANSNVVSAANGLRRMELSETFSTQTVIYIAV